MSLGTSLRRESGKVIGCARRTVACNCGGFESHPGSVPDLARAYRTRAVFAGGAMLNYSRES